MSEHPPIDERLRTLLDEARATGASTSLRAEGAVRLLGHLRIKGFTPGDVIQLEGAKLRDAIPAAGTPVTLTLIQGDRVVRIRTRLREPQPVDPEAKLPPVLQADWPEEAPEILPRREVRVATVDLPPLAATILWQGRRFEGMLLNLTDMGMGLGLRETVDFQPHDEVEVETRLPGASPLRVAAAVRHLELLEDDELPSRVGLVLVDLTVETRETLQRFIQARRMDRSSSLRGR